MELTDKIANALTESAKECFQAVLSIDLEEFQGAVPSDSEHQIISCIGFSGALEGNLSVIFSNQSACAVVGKMLGMDFTEVTSDVSDGVGEVVNMTVGGVKARLTAEYPMEISIPTTVRGNHIDISSQKDLIKIAKSFRSPGFEMDIVLCFKQHTEKPLVHAKGASLSAAEKLAAFVNKIK